jgi:hypothetical protein
MTWELFWERFIGAVKYVMAAITMFAGVTTATSPTSPYHGALGWLYSSRPSLVGLGIIAIVCGGYLIWAKWKKRRESTGRALMFLYLLYTFATILQMVAAGFLSGVSNLIFAILFGLLYLRWRFKTAYVDPNHFRKHIEKLA